MKITKDEVLYVADLARLESQAARACDKAATRHVLIGQGDGSFSATQVQPTQNVFASTELLDVDDDGFGDPVGFAQAIEVALKSNEQARREAMPARLTTAAGQVMVLLEGMKIQILGTQAPGEGHG